MAPQYCGALGKIANCQVAVSLHYAAGSLEEAASAARGWRLFLPREWVDDPTSREKAGVPGSGVNGIWNDDAMRKTTDGSPSQEYPAALVGRVLRETTALPAGTSPESDL